MKEGHFDTATTPGLVESQQQTQIPTSPTFGEDSEEEKEEEEEKDTKRNDIKRHRSTQSSDVSVESRMRAAEQLNSVVGTRWLTVNVSIENLVLDVMSGYNGMRLNDGDEVDKTGHLGTLVARSLRVVSHKCTLGENPNCT